MERVWVEIVEARRVLTVAVEFTARKFVDIVDPRRVLMEKVLVKRVLMVAVEATERIFVETVDPMRVLKVMLFRTMRVDVVSVDSFHSVFEIELSVCIVEPTREETVASDPVRSVLKVKVFI